MGIDKYTMGEVVPYYTNLNLQQPIIITNQGTLDGSDEEIKRSSRDMPWVFMS